MNNDCWCDYEPPELIRKKTPLARKEHRCSECGSVITVGERYEYVSGKWEGDFSTYKTCPDCVAIRDALDEMPCFCWGHGCLWEDIETQFQEADFQPGERFGYLRIVARHRKRRGAGRRKAP